MNHHALAGRYRRPEDGTVPRGGIPVEYRVMSIVRWKRLLAESISWGYFLGDSKTSWELAIAFGSLEYLRADSVASMSFDSR